MSLLQCLLSLVESDHESGDVITSSFVDGVTSEDISSMCSIIVIADEIASFLI